MNVMSSTTNTFRDRWWQMTAWVALAGLLLVLFPRTKVAAHLAGGLAVVTLIWYAWHSWSMRRRGEVCWQPRCFLLKWSVGLYLVTGLFFSVFPHWREGTPELISESLHNIWHITRGVCACMLCVVLCSTEARRIRVLRWIVVAGVMTLISVWVDHVLRGYMPGRDRLFGTVGYPTQLAQMLILCLAAGVMLLFAVRHKADALSMSWHWGEGVLLVLAAVTMLQRGNVTLPEVTPLTGERIRLVAAMLASLLAGVGVAFAIRSHVAGRWAVRVAGLLFLLTILLTWQRMHIIIAGAVVFSAGLWHVGPRWRGRAMVACAVMMTVFCSALYASGRLEKVTSYRHRCLIWDGTKAMIEESWPFGCGFGTKVFQQRWSAYRPDPKAYGLSTVPGFDVKQTERSQHAHNLWMELLVEEGVVGLVVFHLMWGCLLWTYWRRRDRFACWMGLTLALLFLFEGLLHYPLFDRENLTLQGMLYGITLAAGCWPVADDTMSEGMMAGASDASTVEARSDDASSAGENASDERVCV